MPKNNSDSLETVIKRIEPDFFSLKCFSTTCNFLNSHGTRKKHDLIIFQKHCFPTTCDVFNWFKLMHCKAALKQISITLRYPQLSSRSLIMLPKFNSRENRPFCERVKSNATKTIDAKVMNKKSHSNK